LFDLEKATKAAPAFDVTSKEDGRAAAATTAGPEILKSGLGKLEHNDPLAAIKSAIDREPDDARAAEAVAQVIFDDPLGVFFAIADAEAAEAYAESADADPHQWERLFAAYDKRRQGRRRREWPRDWQPYCLVRRADGTWTMLGREYKRLGSRQDQSAPWCDWNAADHVVWRFKDGDPLLLPGGEGKERIWRKPPGLWGAGRLYLPFSEADYSACVGRLVAATVDPPFYATLVLGRLPPTPTAALAA
jgi:hypothetical protein